MRDDPGPVRPVSGGIEVDLHVQPRARRTELAGVHGRALRVRVSAPPADGAANRAVVELLAEVAGVPRARVTLVAGVRSRDKRIRIDGISPEEFAARL